MPNSEEFSNGQTITKDTGTGEDWCLWILAKDAQENVSLKKSESFYLDNETPTAPIIEESIPNAGESKEDITVTISSSQSSSGIAKYQYTLDSGRTWNDLDEQNQITFSETGIYSIIARAINNVGTIGEQSQRHTITINKEEPIIPAPEIKVEFIPNENETYQKEQSTQVVIESKDKISNLKYLWSTKEEGIEAEEITQKFNNKQTIIKDTDSGTWYLWILAQDENGEKVVQRSGAFNLDNEIPSKPNVIKEEQENEAKVTLKISGSTALSGIARYQYSLNNETTWNDLEIGEDLVLNNIGNYTVQVRAISNVDIAGEIAETEDIIVATKKPIILITPNGNPKYQTKQNAKIDVISTINIKQDSLKYIWSKQEEGITELDFEEETNEIESFSNGETISKAEENGIYYIWVYAENEEGESTIQRSNAFYLDSDSPTIENVEDGKIYKEEVTPIIKDETSKIDIKVTKDGEEYNYKLGDAITEDGKYYIVVTDEAGNETKVTFRINTKPEPQKPTEPSTPTEPPTEKPPVDNTIANVPIPNAGKHTGIFIAIIVLTIIAIITFIKWKKQKI